MDDAGTSSESPTLKQAQTELKQAQTKLEEAQTELKQAQTDWLNATENQHIHERMVQSAERMVQSATENVQSAQKMLDHWLEQQPGRADSSEGLLARKIDELKEELRKNEAELKEELRQVAKNEALLMEAFLNRYTLTPVSQYSSATLDGQWHQRAQEYYRTGSCLVLQNLFPDDFQVKPWWLRATRWDSIFPAVAEHIIPKNGFNFVQNELGIEIDNPRNSILLLRHLEHTFQNGDWSLIPVESSGGAVKFKIYVSQNLKEMTVKYIDKNDDSSESVRVRKAKGQALQPLKFWDLHERDFWVHPPPFLRALFLKARMAWRKHKEDDFPLLDPVQFAERFSGFCDKWNDFMVGKLLGSIQQMNSAGGTQSR